MSERAPVSIVCNCSLRIQIHNSHFRELTLWTFSIGGHYQVDKLCCRHAHDEPDDNEIHVVSRQVEFNLWPAHKLCYACFLKTLGGDQTKACDCKFMVVP